MSIIHDIITAKEDHCGESLDCSRRLKFQIIWACQREIDKRDKVIANIQNAIRGHETFDPREQKAIALSRREKL